MARAPRSCARCTASSAPSRTHAPWTGHSRRRCAGPPRLDRRCHPPVARQQSGVAGQRHGLATRPADAVRCRREGLLDAFTEGRGRLARVARHTERRSLRAARPDPGTSCPRSRPPRRDAPARLDRLGRQVVVGCRLVGHRAVGGSLGVPGRAPYVGRRRRDTRGGRDPRRRRPVERAVRRARPTRCLTAPASPARHRSATTGTGLSRRLRPILWLRSTPPPSLK